MPLIAIRDIGGGDDESSPRELDLREVQNGQDISMSYSSYNAGTIRSSITKTQYSMSGYYYDDNDGLGQCTFTCKPVNVSKYNSLVLSATGMETINGTACSVLRVIADGVTIATYSNGSITNAVINLQGKNSMYFQVYQRAKLWKPQDWEYRYVNITKATISKDTV